MQTYPSQAGAASLVAVENDRVRVFSLDTQPEWTIGRHVAGMSSVPDIPFSSTIVSRTHGWIRKIDDCWFFVDNPESKNGTFHNGRKLPQRKDGIKIPVMLESGDVLRIDNKDLNHVSSQGVLMLFTTAAVQDSWTTYPLTRPATIIGSGKHCDLVDPLPCISEQHAKISRVNGSFYLSDCGSSAGTFLNGQPVTGSSLLREKDHISLGDCSYFFVGGKLLYARHSSRRHWHIFGKRS